MLYALCSRLFFDARAACAAVFLASAGLLAGAYFFQYVIGLEPCVLCLYQRIPHAVACVLGLGGAVLAWRGKTKPAAAILFLCAVTYVVSTVLAGYHTGVEQHWWKSAFEGCTAPGIDIAGGNLLAQIQSTAAARCDSIPWQLFGISMAGYNALCSAGLAVYGLVASVLITRQANGF